MSAQAFGARAAGLPGGGSPRAAGTVEPPSQSRTSKCQAHRTRRWRFRRWPAPQLPRTPLANQGRLHQTPAAAEDSGRRWVRRRAPVMGRHAERAGQRQAARPWQQSPSCLPAAGCCHCCRRATTKVTRGRQDGCRAARGNNRAACTSAPAAAGAAHTVGQVPVGMRHTPWGVSPDQLKVIMSPTCQGKSGGDQCRAARECTLPGRHAA